LKDFISRNKAEVAVQLKKRDIVDTLFHAFGLFGHGATEMMGFPYTWGWNNKEIKVKLCNRI